VGLREERAGNWDGARRQARARIRKEMSAAEFMIGIDVCIQVGVASDQAREGNKEISILNLKRAGVVMCLFVCLCAGTVR